MNPCCCTPAKLGPTAQALLALLKQQVTGAYNVPSAGKRSVRVRRGPFAGTEWGEGLESKGREPVEQKTYSQNLMNDSQVPATLAQDCVR